MDDNQSSTSILQTSATIAAIAIALATLADGRGPSIGSLEVFSATLLLGGAFALASSLYAMSDVVSEWGGEWRESLVLLTGGLIITSLAYIGILYDLVNW
jgi:hypothetical protein